MRQQQKRLGWQCLANKYLLESRMLWQVKYGDLDKKSSMFWQQLVPLFGYNMKNWVIKDWSYTVQLCAHFCLHLELQKLQWLLRKESLSFLLICCNIPGREPMCQFNYPLKVQGTVIFPRHNVSSSPSGTCAKVFPVRRMPCIKRVIPGLALRSLPGPGVSSFNLHSCIPFLSSMEKNVMETASIFLLHINVKWKILMAENCSRIRQSCMGNFNATFFHNLDAVERMQIVLI